MNVIFLCETLTTGGAETFVLRLAAAMQARGHGVSLAVIRGDQIERALVESIAPSVPMDAFQPGGLRQLLRVDGLLQRLGLDFSLLRWLQQRWLVRLLSRRGAGLVHSHLITSDLVAAEACPVARVPWLSTMHGDYLAFERTAGNRAARIPDFEHAVQRVEPTVGAIVCITDDQQAQMKRLMPALAARGRIRKIYNGYPSAAAALQNDVPALLRQIPPDAVVVGMVARGIRQKGWDVLLQAAARAQLPNLWLVLVGDGPRIAELRGEIQDPRVVFVGNATNPLDYIARFDIACLPSRFVTESLPTVVIEYLRCGKPVIATHVGEIPAMLQVDTGKPAGVTIALDSEAAMAEELSDALQTLARDPALSNSMSNAALAAFAPFDMDLCVASYEALYVEVLDAR